MVGKNPQSAIGAPTAAATPERPLEIGEPPRPIVLKTFGRVPGGPRYAWSSVFSVVLHTVLIALTLWLSRSIVVAPAAAVTVVFRRPPPPPPPATSSDNAPRRGSRGVALPKAVARDVQPEMELSFAAPTDPATLAPTGRWLGGVGAGSAPGPGWANGVEGATSRHSLARGPQEVNSGWDCGFPGGPTHDVLVRIRVHVTVEGKPTHVTVLRPGPAAFNESARECALRQRFRPALDMEGNPCEGDRELGILFFYPGGDRQPVAAPPAPPPSVPLSPGGPQPDLPVQLDDDASTPH